MQQFEVTIPTLVSYFTDKAPIVDVKPSETLCMVLLEDGSLHKMQNGGGSFMFSTNSSPVHPVPVAEKVVSIACCSRDCAVFQTVSKHWYACGDTSNLAKSKNSELVAIDSQFPIANKQLVTKIVSTRLCYFMLCDNGDLFVAGYGDDDSAFAEMGIGNGKTISKWALCKKNVADVQAGYGNSFLFMK